MFTTIVSISVCTLDSLSYFGSEASPDFSTNWCPSNKNQRWMDTWSWTRKSAEKWKRFYNVCLRLNWNSLYSKPFDCQKYMFYLCPFFHCISTSILAAINCKKCKTHKYYIKRTTVVWKLVWTYELFKGIWLGSWSKLTRIHWILND